MSYEFDYQIANELLARIGVQKSWIARELGITRTTVSKYFTGKAKPSRAIVIAMAKILRVSEADFARKAS